jgi:DNA invertase Pin-like site-specific DNA recombinase
MMMQMVGAFAEFERAMLLEESTGLPSVGSLRGRQRLSSKKTNHAK